MNIFKQLFNDFVLDFSGERRKAEIHEFFHNGQAMHYKGDKKRGTFNNFLQEFNKRKWKRNYDNGWTEQGGNSYIDMSHIVFDGVCMILEGEDYINFDKWKKEQPYYTEEALSELKSR